MSDDRLFALALALIADVAVSAACLAAGLPFAWAWLNVVVGPVVYLVTWAVVRRR